MIIRRLGLHNYKKFRDLSVEFAPGLNVIKGANEAGKSTLHSALRTIFFDKPTTQSLPIKQCKNWQAEDMFALEADITVGPEEYRLRKDFLARKATLSGDGIAETIGDPDAVQERLREWLGCSSGKFFTSTVCIAHDEVARWDAGEIAPQLQRLVAGGDVTARKAVAKLNSALRKLQAGDIGRTADRNPGQLRQVKDRLEELRARRSAIEADVARLAGAKTTAAQCREKLEQINDELSAKSAVVEKNAKAATLKSEIDALKKDDARWRNAKDLKRQAEVTSERLKDFDALVTCEDRLSGLAEDSARLDGKRAHIEALRGAQPEAAAPARGSLAVPIVGVLIMLAGIAAGMTITPGMYVAALAGLGILVFGLMTYFGRPRGAAPADRSQLDALEAETAADSARIESVLAEAGVSSVDEALRRLGELRRAREERDLAERELRGAMEGMSWERLEEQRSGLGVEIERKLEVLADLEPSLLDPVELEQLRRDVAKLGAAKTDCERGISEAGFLINNSDTDADEPARIDDEISELEEKLELLRSRARVYEAAIAGIERAEHETMEKATDAMQSGVGARVERITGGRYREVEVDEGNLSMRVRSDEKQDWASVDTDLSRATRDQFYLAARLSLVDQLCGDARPPLLLDDPFVTFDDERLARTMAVLKETAQERQVLLFTCHDGYEGFADRVIELAAGGIGTAS